MLQYNHNHIEIDWIYLKKSSFSINATRASNLFRDQIQSPMERAVFWTEFLLRHKGADHLKLGSVDLAPYQRDLIDVYIILIVGSVTLFFFTYVIVRHCMCGGCQRNFESNRQKKNQ